jgi:hypothetical protein
MMISIVSRIWCQKRLLASFPGEVTPDPSANRIWKIFHRISKLRINLAAAGLA